MSHAFTAHLGRCVGPPVAEAAAKKPDKLINLVSRREMFSEEVCGIVIPPHFAHFDAP